MDGRSEQERPGQRGSRGPGSGRGRARPPAAPGSLEAPGPPAVPGPRAAAEVGASPANRAGGLEFEAGPEAGRAARRRELLRAVVGVECAVDGLDLARVARASAPQLARLLGIPLEGAGRLEACFRLGREVERSRVPDRARLDSPENVLAVVAPELRGLDRECFLALLVDGRHRLLERHRISVGTLTAALVHPREVFGPALRAGAAGVVVAHNHPSGDPEPSAEDRHVTRRLLEVGVLVGIPLLDHLVVGQPGYVSLRRRGWLT